MYMQYAFLDDTADDIVLSSTPNSASSNGRFSLTHPGPSPHGEACQYLTPQTHRRGLGQYQSSPAVCGPSPISASGGERGSRVFSVNGDGDFEFQGMCEDSSPPGEPEGEPLGETEGGDAGIEFHTHSGSQSSVGSEGYSSPDANHNNPPPSSRPPNHTPSTPHPQSSSVLPEAPPPTTADEGPESVFNRNRSLSMPLRRRRPSSASHLHQRRGVHSVMEGNELSDSMDSGLAATCSNTSLASTDSMQYNALGVSAICILEAVKSMLDHQ